MRGLSRMAKIANWRKATKKSRAATLALLVGGALGFGGANLAATAEDGASGSRRLEAVAKGEDSCFALLVGVDKYDELSPLGCASSDAKALRDVLLEIGFPEENVWMLTSDGSRRERPTKENIEDALDEILEESGPNATVLVALSGHGYETRDGEASFCPKDVEVEVIGDETYVTKDSAIMVDEVTTLLRRDDAKFKMLIVDACRETASTKSARKGRARSFSKPDASGIAFLQSCRSSELSYEDAEFGRGIFTHYFIEGLRGAAGRGDGGASFLDVCGYAASKTKERARKTHKASQTPDYEFAGSDFWLKEPTGNANGEQGEAERLFREGRALTYGLDGRKIDEARGFSFLTAAAELGSNDAKALLASLYYRGCVIMKPDYERAFKLANEAVKSDNPFALAVLGNCYKNGNGVSKNATQAEEYYKSAFEGFKKLAKTDELALWRLACYYEDGTGVEPDKEEAVKYLKRAAEAGVSGAMISLGIYYTNGDIVEKDASKAFELVNRAANLGDIQAMNFLSVCYLHGIGVDKNGEKAVEWLHKSADGGDTSAMTNLGSVYANGNGVEKNPEEAFGWYYKAAMAGSADGMRRLGSCYEEGMGTLKDLTQAFKWYEKAAQNGNREGMLLLGGCYGAGKGVEKDEIKAVEWIRKAAEAGEAQAMVLLGNFYENGTGLRADAAQAFAWYRKSAEAGYVNGMLKLGYCFWRGIGVAEDYSKAFEWFHKAAIQENELAMLILARFYMDGVGVEKDNTQAFKWFAKAADLGNPDGIRQMACCYYYGIGVTQDKTEAVKWFRKAAVLGDVNAMVLLARCYDVGDGIAADDKRAFEWWRKAAEKEHGFGMLLLGGAYESGIGVEKNVDEALRWYRKAAASDDESARLEAEKAIERLKK